ncbi:MAG: alpha-1,3-galactosidase B, partial [Bacteroides sp.]
MNLVDYGLTPDSKENATPLFIEALNRIKKENNTNRKVIITLPKGTYNFHPATIGEREYYISNHDQDNPKKVGLPFENMKNITFDGQGSEL